MGPELLLFDNGLYSGAYYLAGHAVECALKACICRKTQAEDFPLDRGALENVYTHELSTLLKGAELTILHQTPVSTDPGFAVNWATAKDWSEESRYNVYSQTHARDLLQAISDPASGIMVWLQTNW
jgi:hypothetical protein